MLARRSQDRGGGGVCRDGHAARIQAYRSDPAFIAGVESVGMGRPRLPMEGTIMAKLLEPEVKNPWTAEWERAFRPCDLPL